MKKNLFCLFILMSVAAMLLTSCEKDPQKEGQEQHDPAILSVCKRPKMTVHREVLHSGMPMATRACWQQ